MEFNNFYTVESLQYLNDSHDYGYPVSQSDVDKVNRLIAAIRQEREGNERPMPGDIIEYTCRNGDFYSTAHIGHIRKKRIEICLSDNIPFCYENERGAGYDIQEGVWTHLYKSVLEPCGIKAGLFRTWGHAGRCAHGMMYFKTFVRSWKYTEPEPMFGKYTIKEWTKYFISKLPDAERKGEFTYKGEGFTLFSETELMRLVEMLHGELFSGIYRNSLILWGYRMVWEELTEQEWRHTKAGMHLSLLGESPVKIQTCHDTRTVTIYKKK